MKIGTPVRINLSPTHRQHQFHGRAGRVIAINRGLVCVKFRNGSEWSFEEGQVVRFGD